MSITTSEAECAKADPRFTPSRTLRASWPGSWPCRISSDRNSRSFCALTRHLRVRQDHERLLLDAGERIVCHLLRRQVAIAGLRALRDRAQHVGIDALRAQDGDLDAVGPVRDREIFRKPHGGMFGRRIDRAADLREQA